MLGQGLLERLRRVDAVHGERRDGAQGDRVDRPRARRAPPARLETRRGRLARTPRARCRRPAPARAPRPAPRGCGTRPRCHGSRSRSPRRGSAGRCRRGSPSPGRAPTAPRSRSRSVIPASTLTRPELAVGVEDAVERLDPDHRAVGERRLGERVARAGGVDRQAALRRPPDRVDQPVERAGALDRRRRAALVAGPVPPLVRHRAASLFRRVGRAALATLWRRDRSGGRVRLIAAALKAAGPQGPGGSNPSRSVSTGGDREAAARL